MSILIRSARVEDLPIIHELILELATYEKLKKEASVSIENLKEALFGETKAAEVILGSLKTEHKEINVGFALFFHNFSTFVGKRGLYLEDLYVRPNYRGMGYGRALFQRLIEIARERDCGRMEWAVLDWNEPAIKFYKSLGAQSMEDWTLYRLNREGLKALLG
jgi:GNAT superfamily N-acetyltransferase